MPCCAFKACVNFNKKYVKRIDRIKLYRFPTDPVRHEEWSRVVRNERREPYYKASKNARICFEHFKEDDFYSPGIRKRLRKTAIPSIKVHPYKFHTEGKETLIVKIEPYESDGSQDHLNDSVKVKMEADSSCNNSHDGLNDTVIVKIESQASDYAQSELNDTVEVKIEPHASDDLNSSLIVHFEEEAPDNNSQHVLNDSVKVKIEDDSDDDLKDVDISDEHIFDTPLEAALKRKIEKYTLMNEAKTKKIKGIQRQNKRLRTKNKSLKKIIKDLKSQGLIGTEIEAALRGTPELATIFKLLR